MRNTIYLLLAAAMFFSSIWQASATVAANQRAAEQQQVNQAIQQVPKNLPVIVRRFLPICVVIAGLPLEPCINESGLAGGHYSL